MSQARNFITKALTRLSLGFLAIDRVDVRKDRRHSYHFDNQPHEGLGLRFVIKLAALVSIVSFSTRVITLLAGGTPLTTLAPHAGELHFPVFDQVEARMVPRLSITTTYQETAHR